MKPGKVRDVVTRPDEPAAATPGVAATVPDAAAVATAAADLDPCAWAAMRHETFRSFSLFSFIAFIGTSMQNVGAGSLMVSLGGSPLQVSMIQGAMSLSVVLAALVSGALADLHDRRRIMLIALAGLMATTGTIGPLTRRVSRLQLMWAGTAVCGACMLMLAASHAVWLLARGCRDRRCGRHRDRLGGDPARARGLAEASRACVGSAALSHATDSAG